LTELFERVASDARVVVEFLQPVLKPILGGLKMVAKHTGALPYLEAYKAKAGIGFKQVKGIALAKYKEYQESNASTTTLDAVAAGMIVYKLMFFPSLEYL
jgi:hypothetical protein